MSMTILWKQLRLMCIIIARTDNTAKNITIISTLTRPTDSLVQLPFSRTRLRSLPFSPLIISICSGLRFFSCCRRSRSLLIAPSRVPTVLVWVPVVFCCWSCFLLLSRSALASVLLCSPVFACAATSGTDCAFRATTYR